jgi:DNA-directed RNA polymerase specialized sigma24 family protein
LSEAGRLSDQIDLPSMKKEWVLTQDAFNTLLDWLDADRDRAGCKYEAIRRRLIKIFTGRGCYEAEELADETINRVIARVGDVASGYEGDPALYFYGVSQKVHLEYLRKAQSQPLHLAKGPAEGTQNTPVFNPTDSIEPEYECLERCLERLPPNSRDLVLRYYQQDRQAKIDHRKFLATELGIAVNALRIRAHRIRQVLQECMEDCLGEQPAN